MICVTDPEEPTQPDHERPTDPSPPPSSYPSGWPPKLGDVAPVVCPICSQPCPVLDGLYGCCAACAMRESLAPPLEGIRALDTHAVPDPFGEPYPPMGGRPDDPIITWGDTPPDNNRGSFHVDPTTGEVVRGEFVPARDWLDYGKDTGHRLRIKSVDALPDVQHAPADPNGPDPGDIREAHEAYKRASAEGDDAAIAKLFPDVLDELHSKAPGAPPIPELDWTELEPALRAEWREWGRAHAVPGKAIAVRKTPGCHAAEAIIPLDAGDPYHVTSEERTIRMAWREAKGDPKQAASLLVLGAAKEIHRVRAREIFSA